MTTSPVHPSAAIAAVISAQTYPLTAFRAVVQHNIVVGDGMLAVALYDIALALLQPVPQAPDGVGGFAHGFGRLE